MKTAVTVLQEVLLKSNEKAEYVLTPQSGPPNNGQFEYRCKVGDVTVTAISRSKKEAKQKAARQMLRQLAQRGYPVPPPFGKPVAQQKVPTMPRAVSPEAISYVERLKELSAQYHLERLEYEMTSEGGPPQLRKFTVKVRIGHVERSATADTKKMARQLAAEQLYAHLQKNFTGVKRDDENEMPSTMTKSDSPLEPTKNEAADLPTRPDLGMADSEYHLGLTARLDARTRERTYAALEQSRSMSPKRGLATVAAALRLKTVYKTLEREGCSPIFTVELRSCSPDMVFTGSDHTSAAENAIKYLRLTLSPSEPESEDAAVPREYRPNESTPTAHLYLDWDLDTDDSVSGAQRPGHSEATYLAPEWDIETDNTVPGVYPKRPDPIAITYLEPDWDGENSEMALGAHVNRPEIFGTLREDPDPAILAIEGMHIEPYVVQNQESAKDPDHIIALELEAKVDPEAGPNIEKVADPKPAANSEDETERY